MTGVNLTGIIQPDPAMIQDEAYEAGEKILPKLLGKWTLFSIQRIFTKDAQTLPTVEAAAGHEAPYDVQVTWLAADEISYKHTATRFIAQQKEQERLRRQAAASQPKGLVIP